MKRLGSQIRELVESEALTSAHADLLWEAAQADLRELTLHSPALPQPAPVQARPVETQRGAVLEVLGYVGGALLLGAIIFLGFSFWGDLGEAGRNMVAVSSMLVPAFGGFALITLKASVELGKILLALSCYAAGFAYFDLFTDSDGIVSSVVVVVASIAGTILLRSGAFLLSGWSGAVLLVLTVVLNERSRAESIPQALTIGFLIVAAVMTAAGFVLSKALAWSLAGISGWAAGFSVLFSRSYGEWFALLLAAVVAVALLFAFVRLRRYAFAVIGCLILLSLWPVSLFQIFESASGVALGLIAAGAVLIAVVVLQSRRPGADAGTTGP